MKTKLTMTIITVSIYVFLTWIYKFEINISEWEPGDRITWFFIMFMIVAWSMAAPKGMIFKDELEANK